MDDATAADADADSAKLDTVMVRSDSTLFDLLFVMLFPCTVQDFVVIVVDG